MLETTNSQNIVIDVHLTAQDPQDILEEIREGLLSTPRRFPTKYFYDDRGSSLFERICELPEYYQTRTEHELLKTVADDVIGITKADELVELGSGAATKTRVLLDAMARAHQLRFYVPFDVSEGIVRRVAQELVKEYEGLLVHGVVGDFLAHLEHIPDGGRRLVVILGGTIGNLGPQTGAAFLTSVQAEMASGDFFLLGVQLITDVNRLESAYNDAGGVTAEFNKNILYALKTVIGADFNPETFDHVARFNEAHHRIEMHLRSTQPQSIPIPGLNLTLHLKKDEEILTEISTKFNRAQVEQLLSTAGFVMVEWYTDPSQLHGLALAKKP